MTDIIKIVAVTMYNAEGECETACRCYAGPDGENGYEDLKNEAHDECVERFNDLNPENWPCRVIVQHYEAPAPRSIETIVTATLPEQAKDEATVATKIG